MQNNAGKTKNVSSDYGRFNNQMKAKLEKISQWMISNNMSTAQLHDTLDRNKDGDVDKQEFVNGMAMLQIAGLMQKDFVMIFETIDIDNNMFLSLNEFSLYLEGATKKREQRLNELPVEITRDIEN